MHKTPDPRATQALRIDRYCQRSEDTIAMKASEHPRLATIVHYIIDNVDYVPRIENGSRVPNYARTFMCGPSTLEYLA